MNCSESCSRTEILFFCSLLSLHFFHSGVQLCKSLGSSLLKLDISSAPALTLRSVAHALRHCARLEALFFVCLMPFARPTQDSIAVAAQSSLSAALEELHQRFFDGLALRQLWLANTQVKY